MQAVLPTCSKCRTVLPAELCNLPALAPCPSCTTPVQAIVFPALFKPVASTTAENVIMEGEASCFYHSQKKAIVPCDSCGRFLCALCDVELSGRHICPGCLEAGKTKGKIKNLQQKRTRYDRIVVSLAVLPLLIFYLTFITAPMAIYLSIKHWNTEVSIVPRKAKLRFVTAIVLASLQILGWILLIYFMIKS